MVFGLTMLVLLAPGGTVSDAADGWRLQVRSAATVAGPVVLLGEVAEPMGRMDERTWDSLSRIKLWKASDRPGRVVVVSRAKLREIFRFYMGDQAKRLILPSQMAVQTGGKAVSGPELRSRVVGFLTARATAMNGEAEIRDVQTPMHFFLASDSDRLELSMDDPLEPGRVKVQLRAITPDGRVMKRSVATAFLNIWKTVPSAAMPLNRLERLSRDKVSFTRVNLAYHPDVWDGTGGPWRMKRSLGRGQPITMQHIEALPAVERGETVDLIYKGRRIHLTIKAEALGEARIGQQVAVRNLQSKRTVMGTVVGDDQVMVR